ncbi:hypothetical protein ACKX2D_07335 [Lachnospiraceae bacterium YH-ros2226]
MKRTISILAVAVAYLLLLGCTSNKTDVSSTMNIDPKGIEEITASSQMSNPKQDIVLKKDQVEELVKKLNSYSLKEIQDDDKKGWQYAFTIERKGDDKTQISFIDHTVQVDDKTYEVKDYKPEDFSYLFE